MADVGQVYYRVIDTVSGEYVSSAGIDIYKNIVTQFAGAKQFNKIGIQAPPGTRLVLNDSKTIMVGRTGIYELDDDIAVISLYFVRPRKYELDTVASEQARQAGMQGINTANTKRQTSLNSLAAQYPKVPTEKSDSAYDLYWGRYQDIQSTYMTDYKTALNKFNTGNNGIYKLPNEKNIDAPENFEELQNVTVDFIYT